MHLFEKNKQKNNNIRLHFQWGFPYFKILKVSWTEQLNNQEKVWIVMETCLNEPARFIYSYDQTSTAVFNSSSHALHFMSWLIF